VLKHLLIPTLDVSLRSALCVAARSRVRHLARLDGCESVARQHRRSGRL